MASHRRSAAFRRVIVLYVVLCLAGAGWSAPGVDNGAGPTSDFFSSATIRGRITNDSAQVYLCWGDTPGDTSSTGSWRHVAAMGWQAATNTVATNLAGLLYGVRYHYVTYATNAGGVGWAQVTNFITSTAGLPAIGLPVTHGLVVHLDASRVDANDTISEVRRSGPDTFVRRWDDQSGNGNHASQWTQDDQPRYIANGLNALPVLRFAEASDTAGDQLQLGDLSVQFPSAASFFAVATIDNDGRYSLFGNRDNDGRWVANTWSEAVPGSFRTTRISGTYANWPQNGSRVFAFESSSSIYRFVIDGSVADSATPAYHSGSGVDWTIGDGPGNIGQQLRGDIAELLLFNRVLSGNEADDVGGYLAERYGLSAAYPEYHIGLCGPVNGEADPIGSTNATLNGTLHALGSVFDVYVYWGTEDGVDDPSAWNGGSAFVGSYTDVVDQALSTPLSGLIPQTRYFYTHFASNAAGTLVASPSTNFTAKPPPGAASITNTGIADLSLTTVDLAGALGSTGTSETIVSVHWGREDAGDSDTWEQNQPLGTATAEPSNYVQTVTVQSNFVYAYTYSASNSIATGWGEERFTFLPGYVTIEATTPTLCDGDTGVFTVRRPATATNLPLFVNVAIDPTSTAVGGVDFTDLTSTNLWFAAGESSKTVELVVADRATANTVSLKMEVTAAGSYLGGGATAEMAITIPEVWISDGAGTVDEGQAWTSTVQRTAAATNFDLTVTLAENGGDALYGVDYGVPSLNIEIEAGATSAPVVLTAAVDLPPSDDGEVARLRLEPGLYAIAAPSNMAVTIRDVTLTWWSPVGLGHSDECGAWGSVASYPIVNNAGVLDFEAGTHSTDPADMWLSGTAGATTPHALRFDLQRVFRLNRIRVLNFNRNGETARCTKDIELHVSEFGERWELIGGYTLPQSAGSEFVNCGTNISLPEGTEARFFRIDCLSNYGGDRSGLSEVRFEGTPLGYGEDIPATVAAVSSEELGWGGFMAGETVDGNNGPRWQYRQADSVDGKTWLTDVGDWTDGSDPPAWIEYDLGGMKYVAAVRVWNSNARPAAGVSNVVLQVSEDRADCTDLGTFTLRRADDKELTFAGTGSGGDASDNDFSQILELPIETETRYVRFDIQSNYGDATYVGLKEVQFIEAPVPPPKGSVLILR